MSRLSLWKDGKHSNDYKFMDRRISEMFTIGGTGILVNKYLGTYNSGSTAITTIDQGVPGFTLAVSSTSNVSIGDFVYGGGIPSGTKVIAKNASSITLDQETTVAVASGASIGFSNDATKPTYLNQSAQNIQDLLLIENRDRKYDTSVYKMRGIYQRADQDFDLSQFGLFLQTGTIFMVFHLRDMVDLLGRKLMAGDVLELQHLKDYDALNGDLPAALKRYYVVGDASFASEGFSPTWWPHLWRVKLNPLVDSQEYKDIIDNIAAGDGTTATLSDVLSTYNKYIDINEAIVSEAESNVPVSGYDTTHFYVEPKTNTNFAGDPMGVTADGSPFPALTPLASNTGATADEGLLTPDYKVTGYLTQDGIPPNGLPCGVGISFPDVPKFGDFFLRTDYLPNRLFRFDGKRWVKVEDDVRTTLTPGPDNQTLRSGFVNNTNTYTTVAGQTHNERQSLSKALTPKADN
jgi:hypothetical protein